MSPKAQAARYIARFFGGAALAGTKAQVEWAERVRAEKLAELPPESALLVAADALTAKAGFWLDNRESAPALFAAFVTEKNKLLAAHKAARAANDAQKIKATADAYNSLTLLWGFK